MLVTKKQATIDAIRPRRWVSAEYIEQQGGSLRSLRRLRGEEGYEIKSRSFEGVTQYRLVGVSA